MEKKPGGDQFGYSGPARYRIVVAGNLPADWSDRLAGMTITRSGDSSAGDDVRTTLEGLLLDQAQLSGVLDTLYHLHLSILRVTQLEDRNSV